MGFSSEEIYSQKSIGIKPDDLIIFYSDGIIQALDAMNKPYGIERLCHHIKHNIHMAPKELAENIFESVKTYTNKPTHCDDLTCIIVKIESETQHDTLLSKQYEVKADLIELVKLRTFIRSTCQGAPMDLSEEFISHMELATNEAASNIVLQACKDIPDAQIKTNINFYDDQAVIELTHPGSLPGSTKITSAALDGSDNNGFALYVLRQCVDKVEYLTLADGLNSIKLIKYIN